MSDIMLNHRHSALHCGCRASTGEEGFPSDKASLLLDGERNTGSNFTSTEVPNDPTDNPLYPRSSRVLKNPFDHPPGPLPGMYRPGR